jgi:DNA-binding MarR family transcriptional regulator
LSTEHMSAWVKPPLGRCACTQLRAVTRTVTSFYDQAISKTGVTVTQYAVLVNIGRRPGVSITELATSLRTDRTTLTRILRPLVKGKLVRLADVRDGRTRSLQLTPVGRKRLESGYLAWESAQKRFITVVGARKRAQLQSLLDEVMTKLEAEQK